MERNIFEAAANKAKKVAEDHPTINKSRSHDPVIKKNSNLSGKIVDDYGVEDPEVVKMFSRMREMRLDLENQLDSVKKKGEESKFDVEAYLAKSVHFRPQEIEKSLQDQKEFEEKINDVLSPESCLKKIKKSKEKLTQERKNKTLGSRKKWIPMR